MYRGDSRDAADLVRGILANHDQPPVTAYDYAAQTPGAALPDRVRSLLGRRTTAADRRRLNHQAWQAQAQDFANFVRQARERHTSRSRDRSSDTGIEL
jgi:hypothetical protein